MNSESGHWLDEFGSELPRRVLCIRCNKMKPASVCNKLKNYKGKERWICMNCSQQSSDMNKAFEKMLGEIP